jgi:hypothetical protein
VKSPISSIAAQRKRGPISTQLWFHELLRGGIPEAMVDTWAHTGLTCLTHCLRAAWS